MKKQLIITALMGLLGAFANANNVEMVSDNFRKLQDELNYTATAPKAQYFKDIDLNNYSSAIVINLDGEHISTTHVKKGVYFDHDANQYAEKSSWITKGNAFLVLPKSNKVTTGHQLFGSNMRFYDGFVATDGFTALRKFDINNDGALDAKDPIFSKLHIWEDHNQNGRVEKDELRSLKDEKIIAIATKAEYEPVDMMDENDNVYRLKATMTKEDSTRLNFYDVWLKQDYVDTQDRTAKMPISQSIRKLPNLAGMGNVSNLHQTMVRDSTGKMEALLTSIVHRLRENAALDDIRPEIDQLIILWTGGEHLSTELLPENVSVQYLNVLESFWGRKFNNLHGSPQQLKAFDQSYMIIFNWLFDDLVYSTRILGHLKNGDIMKDPITQQNVVYSKALSNALVQQFDAISSEDFVKTIQIFNKVYKRPQDQLIYGQVLREIIEARPTAGSLLAKNTIHIPQSTPEIRAIECRLKEKASTQLAAYENNFYECFGDLNEPEIIDALIPKLMQLSDAYSTKDYDVSKRFLAEACILSENPEICTQFGDYTKSRVNESEKYPSLNDLPMFGEQRQLRMHPDSSEEEIDQRIKSIDQEMKKSGHHSAIYLKAGFMKSDVAEYYLDTLKNPTKTVEWLEKIAGYGNTEAMKDLVYLYHYGYGVPQDFNKVKMWYHLMDRTIAFDQDKNMFATHRYPIKALHDYDGYYHGLLKFTIDEEGKVHILPMADSAKQKYQDSVKIKNL